MVEQAEKELEPTMEELEAVEKLLKKTNKKIDKFMTAFGDEEEPTIAKALEREIKKIAELKSSLERQKADLESKIATAKVTPSVRKKIIASADEVRKRLENGGTSENKVSVIEALNVRAQLVEENGKQKIKLTCGLGTRPKFISINDHSSA
jgi:ATPase subunit of ABC transporter with duplicated ATPase domains